jgi:hypothetical protein
MDRAQIGFRRHLGPLTHTSDMTGVPQGDDRDPSFTGFGDPELDRLWRYRLTESISAIDNGERFIFRHDCEFLVPH